MLVAFHTVGRPGWGLEPDPVPVLLWIDESFLFVRMPLFAAIAGYLYGLIGTNRLTLTLFYRRKLLRLLLPFLVAATLMLLARLVKQGLPDEGLWGQIEEIYLYPYRHLWYLQALFVLFIAIAPLDRLGLLDEGRKLAIVFALGIGLFLWGQPETPFFALDHTSYLLPYFLVGVAIARFRVLQKSRLVLAMAPAIAVGVLLIEQLILAGVLDMAHERRSVLGLIGGSAIAGTLLLWPARLLPLAIVGAASYSVYLYHPFGEGLVHVVLTSLSLSSEVMLAVFGLAGGVALPMLFDRIVRRYPALALVFLGERLRGKAGVAFGDAEGAGRHGSPKVLRAMTRSSSTEERST